MAEQQLIDYIKRARQAGQTDQQSQALLYKNGWTEAEVKDAFDVLSQPQVQNKPQYQEQISQIQEQPQIQTQPQPEPQYQPQYQPQTIQTNAHKSGGWIFLMLKVFIALIILSVIGGGAYLAIGQPDLLESIINKIIPSGTEIEITNTPIDENKITEKPEILSYNLATTILATISADYDINKGLVGPAFSPVGDKVAYCAQKKTGNKFSCFINNDIIENYDDYKPINIAISPNGKRVVFLYSDTVNNQSFIVESGAAESLKYTGSIDALKFSADSKNFAYIVTSTDGAEKFIVVNGSELKADQPVNNFVFSADSKKIAYGGTNFIILRDILGGQNTKYDTSVDGSGVDSSLSIVFSPDSKKLLYVLSGETEVVNGETCNNYYLVVNGEKQDKYNFIGDTPNNGLLPIFSSDSQKIGFIANTGCAMSNYKEFVAIKSAPGTIESQLNFPVSSISNVIFDADGLKIAYAADKSYSIVIDDKKYASKLAVVPFSLIFSPEGASLFYKYYKPVTNGKTQVVTEIDITAGTSKEYAYYSNGSNIVFSPDGKMAYVGIKNMRRFIVLNGQAKTEYDRIYGNPIFSPNGEYILYGVRDGQNLTWIADKTTEDVINENQ